MSELRPGDPPAPNPDDKDWTWTLERPCPDCGYDAAQIDRTALPDLVLRATGRVGAALARADAARRPAPSTWSVLEYACHVRDVCTIFTVRLELMLAQEEPCFENWDQDATALQERYWEQAPADVRRQLDAAADAIAAGYGAVREDQWRRTGMRSNGSRFTVDTLGRYLLHDLVHHVHDVDG